MRLKTCPMERTDVIIPTLKCHNPIREFAPLILSKTIPVTDTNKNTIDSAIVTLLFLPIPFFTTPLYQLQCVIIWNITVIRNKKLVKTWNTAQLCHTSWAFPCPAICNPIPEHADRANVKIRIQSITKIFFICFRFILCDKGRHSDRTQTITIVKIEA